VGLQSYMRPGRPIDLEAIGIRIKKLLVGWFFTKYNSENEPSPHLFQLYQVPIVGTLPDGYLRTSPLPRIDTRKYRRVPPVSRDYLGLHSSQPYLPAPICVWANRCSHNLLTTTVIATSSVCLFNTDGALVGVCFGWRWSRLFGCGVGVIMVARSMEVDGRWNEGQKVTCGASEREPSIKLKSIAEK
jgi:hypothetical protein